MGRLLTMFSVLLLSCTSGGTSFPYGVEKDAGMDSGPRRNTPLDSGPQDFWFYPEPPRPPNGRLWEAGVDPTPPRCACFVYPVQKEGGWLCFVEVCSEHCPRPGPTGSEVCFRVRTD